MTIATEIQRIKNNIIAAFDACIAKGVEIVETKNSLNLASVIARINTVKNQDKTVDTNCEVTCDSGYTGLGKVTVQVPNGVEEKTISNNGIFYPSGSNIGFSKVTVEVPELSATYNSDNNRLTFTSGIKIVDNKITIGE